MRGQDTVRALVNAEWAQARALARERMTVVGTAEYAKAHAAVLELGEEMRVLERTLCERPWTET